MNERRRRSPWILWICIILLAALSVSQVRGQASTSEEAEDEPEVVLATGRASATIVQPGRAVITARGNHMLIDSPAPSGGPNETYNPLDAFLTGMLTCAIFVYERAAEELDIPLNAISAEIEADFAVQGLIDGSVDPRIREFRLSLELDGPTAEEANTLRAQYMLRCPLYATLIQAAPIHVTHVGLDQAASPNVQEIAAFDPAAGQLPEGIAIDADNNVYVGMALTGEIIRLTPDGEVVSFARLPSPGDGFLLGMEFDDAGNLYAALASFDPETQGLYVVGPDGGDAELVVALDSEGLPNDVTIDSQGNVYVTNSIGGQVWRIDSNGELEVWVADDLLLGVIPPGPPLNIPIGANGLVFNADESYLYVASSELGRIVRFPVNDDGSAGAGELIVESELLGGADGLAFDAEGTLYVAVFFSDSIMTVSPEGDLTVVAQGGLLQNPSTLKFGHGDQAGTLFAVNFGLMRVMELMPGAPEPRAMRIHLD
jgi:sugar lactone lactonase YvrE